MAITGIDHVVILADDLTAATARYATLGFEVAPGGRHPAWGTENALIPLADGSYLELLAARDPALAARHRLWRRPDGGVRLPGEYGGFAVASNDIEGDAAAIRARGLSLEGPTAGSRVRPDGREVRWRLAFAGPPELPFLIQDDTPRTWRIAPPSSGLGAAAGIDEVTVVVADLARATRACEQLVGVSAASSYCDPRGQTVRFQLPLADIVLLQPEPDDPTRDFLDRTGSGVFSVTLNLRGRTDQWPSLRSAMQDQGAMRVIDVERVGGLRIIVRERLATR